MLKLSLLFFMLMPHASFGVSKAFRIPVIPAPNTSVKISIPYTFGTHTGEARLFSGKIVLDLDNPAKSSGSFTAPINSITTGNEERDCHLMEALGLDYGLADFPENHVCSDTHNLPAAGKNAPKYPMIHLALKSIKTKGTANKIFTDKETAIEVDGEWTIHGKSYRWAFPMKLIPEGENFRVRGDVPFSLKNHDIIIKPFQVLFIDVSVKDIINVSFDLLLEADTL